VALPRTLQRQAGRAESRVGEMRGVRDIRHAIGATASYHGAHPEYHDLNERVLQDVPLTSIIGGRLEGSLSFLYSGAPSERRCSGSWRP
jgi:hypothetical protein